MKYNIKLGYTEIDREDVDWTHVALYRIQRRTVVKTVMNIWIP
jgi:hypothetical protein